MRGCDLRLRASIILVAGIGVASGVLAAAGSDFIPRPTRNGAFVDLFASRERDENSGNVRSFGWSDTFFKEKLTLYSNGYFYHPRLLQYRASIAAALKQERYEASYLPAQDWRSDHGAEYEGRLFFLPEHPYNLEIYALRYEPLYKTQSATQHDSLQSTRGALFQYRRQPWFAHARATDSTTRSGVLTSKVRRLGVDGEYFTRFRNGNHVSVSGAYNPTRFSHSQGLEGSSSEVLFGNTIDLQRVRLNSNVTRNMSEQENGPSGRYDNDQFTWYEILSAYFPMNVRSDLTFRRLENDSTIPDPLSSLDRTYSDTSREVQLDVVHRLFQSLDTRYRGLDISRESSGSDSDFRSHALFVNYTKVTPAGRLLAGLNRGRSRLDSRGRGDVVDEPHPGIAVPGGVFALGQQNVDPGSVAVFLMSTVAPFQAIFLQEGPHYVVTPVLNSLEITMLDLPPPFLPPGNFDLFVDYSLSTGAFGLSTGSVGGNLSIELLDTMLVPYYGYAAIQSEVLSGSFPGIPLDSTTHTAGLRFHRGPLRALGEYQNLQWDVSPYRAWKTELQYIGSVDPRTRVYVSGSYVNKYYPRGTSGGFSEPYTDENATAFGSIQKQFVPNHMVLSAGGSFSRLRGRVEGNAYTLNGSLSWRIGRLDLSAGASASKSDLRGSTAFSSDRLHQYYYVSLRREIF